MCNLMPFISSYNNVEATYQKAIPHVVKALATIAVRDSQRFLESFDVLQHLCDSGPTLLNDSLKTLIDFCFKVAKNEQLKCFVRTRTVTYIRRL